MRAYDPRKHNPDVSWAIARFVYGIQCGQFIKVGVTRDLTKRLHDMRLLNPHPITVILQRKIRAPFFCEQKMHEILSHKAIGREWFNATSDEVLAAYEVGLAYAREIGTHLTQRGIRNSNKAHSAGLS